MRAAFETDEMMSAIVSRENEKIAVTMKAGWSPVAVCGKTVLAPKPGAVNQTEGVTDVPQTKERSTTP